MAISLNAGSFNTRLPRWPIGFWLLNALKRTGGLALMLVAVFLAVSFWGHDPGDPSWNRASAGQIANPAGWVGAATADLAMQLFGRAAWLLPAISFCWGVRLILGKSWRWPWLPVLALPLALLAIAAWLAAATVPNDGSWAFRTGLGGVVGDLIYGRFSTLLDPRSYNWAVGLAAVILTVIASAIRFGEGFAAARHMGGHAGNWGRTVGGAALTATEQSGRWVGEQWQQHRSRSEQHERMYELDDVVDEPPARRGTFLSTLQSKFARNALPETDCDVDSDLEPFEPHKGIRNRRPIRQMGHEPEQQQEDLQIEPPKRRPPVKPKHSAPAGPPQPELPLDDYELPDLDFLTPVRHANNTKVSKNLLEETSEQLKQVLRDFGVHGEIIDAKPGPVITLYELEPAPGTRAQRVINLADDIMRSLCALSVRVATVPGRNVIGIEVPNDKRQIVFLKELLELDTFTSSEARLALALGKDISGRSIIVDLARMPHLLIAGTTGSGKSVAINSMILSLLYKLRPEQCRIIMIDPKVIELSVYEGIPHLLAPVVTEPHKAVVALKWVVRQMDERYRLMSHLGVRDIFAYNRRIEQAKAKGQELTRVVRTGFEPGTGQPIMEEQPIDMTPLPLIVVIVDEVADLMLTAGKEIENAIQRLSQKARAAGIHLIVATQRPSVDVLTGVIKANLPSRISFRVSSKIDSRTILGEPGAEQLLGQGDMLYMMPGDRIMRVHGPLVSDMDVEKVVTHLKRMGEPEYDDAVTAESFDDSAGSAEIPVGEGGGGNDGLYNQAVQIVARDGKASTSYLQRKLSIGYNSAAKLIERMEAEGLISHADHVGRRQVLMGRGGVDGNEPTHSDI